MKPSIHVDLAWLPKIPGLHATAENTVRDVQTIQAEVKYNLEKSNTKYKAVDDKHRRNKVLQQVDIWLWCFCARRGFPWALITICSLGNMDRTRYRGKLNDNFYLINLPQSMSISKTFNVVDIYPYFPSDTPLYPQFEDN